MDKQLTRAAVWPGCARAMTTLARLARLCVADYAWQRPAMNGEQGVVHGARLAQQRLRGRSAWTRALCAGTRRR